LRTVRSGVNVGRGVCARTSRRRTSDGGDGDGDGDGNGGGSRETRRGLGAVHTI
jgi:hypothetical protein